jgi:CubicO group peptidase (beta-lactamase class C family)
MFLATVVAVASAPSRPPRDVPSQIRAILQSVALNKSITYNCSVSIAFKNADHAVAAAAGSIGSGRKASTEDAYAWGSGTKPLTGASILKLISEGEFTLESSATSLLDPILAFHSKRDPSIGFSSLAELWGADNVSFITIGHLLNMTSGIPDFDTAKGAGRHGGAATDSLRAELYKNPTRAYSPWQLMALPWVAQQYRPCHDVGPRWHKCYSSTNFMLLGLLLANRTGWQSFDQASFLPRELRGALHFGSSGAPRDFTAVHGYDRTAYNMPSGVLNDRDVSDIDGVFAGWTASDLVGSASNVASLVWAIYGPSPTVLPPSMSRLMVRTAMERDYGLATFNLTRDTGQSGELAAAVGHLGATYGFQSQLLYFPKLEFALAVATNIETDAQTQPKDAVCFAYNGIAGVLLGKDVNCTFAAAGYYRSGCKCTPM